MAAAAPADCQHMEDEVAALQSIYETSFMDLRKADAWHVWRPPEVRLMLTPQQSSRGTPAYCRVALRVKCGRTYPDNKPEIFLEKPEGLSVTLVRQLKAELEALASEHRGEVVIFLLAQHIQLFLHDHNAAPKTSFYDQMNKTRCEEQSRTAAAAVAEEIRLAKVQQEAVCETERQLCEEIARRQAERRKQRQHRDSQNSDRGVPLPESGTLQVHRSRSASLTASGDVGAAAGGAGGRDCPLCQQAQTGRASRGRLARSLIFPVFGAGAAANLHKILRSGCIGHGTRATTVCAAVDFETGDLFALTEWVLTSEAAKALAAPLSQELATLVKLDHPHLCKYISFVTSDLSPKNAHSRLYLLSEFVHGKSLANCMRHDRRFSLREVHLLAKQLVDVFCYLHSRSLAHKNLRAASVLLDVNNFVRLTDFCIDKRLEDAVDSAVTTKIFRPRVYGRSVKKVDVYRLGLLLLEIVLGREFTASDDNPKIPSRLPSALHDFLDHCLHFDEQKRWSFAQLRQHSFLNQPIVGQPPRHFGDMDRATGDDSAGSSSGDESDGFGGKAAPPPIVEPKVPATERPVIETVDEFYGASRLKDFEVLHFLGKGAFGDVIKVRNKLDKRFYAVKRVKLNCTSERQNKRMLREVKVLSTMMHENVVRYFNAWIEVEALTDKSSSHTGTTSSELPTTTAPTSRRDSSIAAMVDVPLSASSSSSSSSEEQSADWATNRASSRHDFEGDSDSDFEDILGKSCLPFNSSDSEDSEYVIFDSKERNCEYDDDSKEETDNLQQKANLHRPNSRITLPRQRYIYLQMEFCEKTLRDAIIKGLCKDEKRVWRLFREVVEGLEHIHERKIIHRDLKPANIFLDSGDHAKIGDFGLATSSVRSRSAAESQIAKDDEDVSLAKYSEVLNENDSADTGSNMTSNVGTFLYNSPEVTNSVDYTEKVDIYSLGVIFFEMCYSFRTSMERVEKIRRLRSRQLRLPDDFEQDRSSLSAALSKPRSHHVQIIQWLVQHDPELRPSATQLLASELMPPPLMEECTLREILRSAMVAPESKPYRTILESFFRQKSVSVVTDFLFDAEQHTKRKGVDKVAASVAQMNAHRAVCATFRRVFARHGAVEMDTPLIMPRQAELYGSADKDQQLVRLLDTSGLVVTLPFDQRVPYARLVAKAGAHALPTKRFSMSRVFRRQRYAGHQAVAPREAVECAFDIVTPVAIASNHVDTCVLADAELLHLLHEVTSELPGLQDAPLLLLRLNHSKLIEGVLMFCGVPPQAHAQVCELFASSRNVSRPTRDEHTACLLKLGIQEHALGILFNIMKSEGSVKEISAKLKVIVKTRSEAAARVKKALHELESVLEMANALGPKHFHKVLVTPNLVKNYKLYSGLMVELSAELRGVGGDISRRRYPSVLAEGGRYDQLLQRFSRPNDRASLPAATGVSWALDQLVALHRNPKHEEWCKTPSVGAPRLCDVLVCAQGHRSQLFEQARIAGRLWAAGVSVELALLDADPELLQKQCRERQIPLMVLIRESERGLQQLRLRNLDRDRVNEMRVATVDEMVGLVVARCGTETGVGSASLESGLDGAIECSGRDILVSGSTNSSDGGSLGSGNSSGVSPAGGGSANRHSRLQLETQFVEMGASRVNKMAPNVKRKLEAQVWSRVIPLASALSTRNPLSVLVVDLPAAVLATLSVAMVRAGAGSLAMSQLNVSDVLNAAQRTTAENHQRHRKYLDRVFDELHRLKSERRVPLCGLYSQVDDALVLIVL